jgi:Polysaccharide deacetylase
VGWLHFGGGTGQSRAGHASAGTRPAPGLAATWREWLSFPGYRDVVPVLMYHSVGGRPSYITTSRALFAEQMRALRLGGFHTLTLRQYAAYSRGSLRGLPERPVLLTFDDGRKDAYLAAGGILRKYGFHATELAVPGWVTGHPGFSVSWAQLAQMHHGTTWDVASHFGYGQAGTNDPRIRSFVLSWLDYHFAVVFGGDYLDQGKGRPLAIPGRFSPRLSYRMSLGPRDTLPVFHCRLSAFVHQLPIAAERCCARLAPAP